MSRIAWTTPDSIAVAGRALPVGPGVDRSQAIRRIPAGRLPVLRALYPLARARDRLFGNEFIIRRVGQWLRDRLTPDSVVLDAGCGAMRFRPYLPAGTFYNAFDLALSEFHVRRVAGDRFVNLALASLLDIPVADSRCSIVLCTEVLEHVPAPEAALREIRRVLRPGGHLLASIPNNYCFKYRRLGANDDHCNNWTFQEFQHLVRHMGFAAEDAQMMGVWIPLPRRLTGAFPYHLPITHPEELYNTNFLYALRAGGR
ncbi:MAG: class I SAM-dependent methyltransferase [Chloroflexi bacterium]|nr:class I SAM-dependent methyltransferase [Chloroflexota bacterium]